MRELQQQIIQELQVKPQIDPALEVRQRVNFLKDYLSRYPFLKSLVLGISGGQDSTLAGKLCQIAIDELRQTHPSKDYQFIAVRLPYGNQFDETDARYALDFIKADLEVTINIKKAVDALVLELADSGWTISDFNKGNIKARQRMIAQYAVAGERAGVVVGTDHAAESVTGFYTKFGDGASDLMPLFGLNKRQGRQLLAYLQAPQALYEKIPTADLEELTPAKPDEEALGVSYQDIDDYLEGRSISKTASDIIEDWYLKTQHKRHLPITLADDFWR